MENSKTKRRISVRIGTTPYSPAPADGVEVLQELELDVPSNEPGGGNLSTQTRSSQAVLSIDLHRSSRRYIARHRNSAASIKETQ